jgi:hypothetical protein
MKNKLKSAISAAAVAALTAPALAFAQFAPPTGTQLPSGTITGIITQIMNWLLGLVGILGVIGFAIAGILYLTAAGDEDRIGYAKRAMTWSIVGVIVALLGLVIVRAAASMLGGGTSTY